MSICQWSNFKVVFKKWKFPLISKNLQTKPLQIYYPVKSAGRYEAEYKKFINVNRSFNFAELAALPTEIFVNKLP
jgi:hypothetical protein